MGGPEAGSGRSGGEQGHGMQLEQVVDSLRATTAIAQALVGETDLDTVLGLIASRGRELVAARWSAILIVDGDELELRATAGDPKLRPIGHRYPIDATLAGRTLRGGRPRTVTDLSRHAAPEDRELVEELGAEHALIVPLDFRGEGVGVLVVAADVPDGDDGFSAEQQELLLAFGASAATAIAAARSVATERLRQSVAAAERERRRWARELHDETLQDLGGALMLIDAARGRGKRADLAATLDGVADSLQSTIAALHRMISELRPATLDELGVEAAVVALAERRRSETLAITVAIDLDYEQGRRPTRLVPEIEGAIYRIVQEALTNVHKHAQARHAEITVDERHGTVLVAVRDDGRGRGSASDSGGSGLGLAGMRERVTLIGGSLDVSDAPDGGTVVRATLPATHV
jgi:signal transduction histidine kinase